MMSKVKSRDEPKASRGISTSGGAFAALDIMQAPPLDLDEGAFRRVRRLGACRAQMCDPVGPPRGVEQGEGERAKCGQIFSSSYGVVW